MDVFIIALFIIAPIIAVVYYFYCLYRDKKIDKERERIHEEYLKHQEEYEQKQRQRTQEFLSGFTEWSAKEFLIKKRTIGEITGVYILYNSTKNMYYVGQSVKAVQRVNNHLSGRGNGDVYADYKYGDSFTVKIIPLNKSGYSTLDELESKMISTYNAYSLGYNKTRGNSVRS